MTLALTQTHIIEQHFYTQRASSKIALLHKKPAGPLLHFIFFPKQLKANLIRINYISHGLQGFKQCLFNLIFFFFFYKPRTSFQSTHEGRCSRSDIWPPEIECVCVCVSLCFCVRVHVHQSIVSASCLIAEGFCNYTSRLWVTEPLGAAVSVNAWLRPRLAIVLRERRPGQQVMNSRCADGGADPTHLSQVTRPHLSQ